MIPFEKEFLPLQTPLPYEVVENTNLPDIFSLYVCECGDHPGVSLVFYLVRDFFSAIHVCLPCLVDLRAGNSVSVSHLAMEL